MNNFNLINCDTDSITFSKQDGAPFTEQEQERYLEELNALFPQGISWEHDGIYPSVVVAKAKNYILFDGEEAKIKGSALKASTKEPALKEFIKAVIDSLLKDRDDFELLYKKYALEAVNVKEIKRWASRKTISDKVLKSERLNESKVRDAIAGEEVSEGDRRYFFYLPDDSLELAENFKGEYNKERLLKKLHDTSKIFSTILPTKDLFPNYTLKKNKSLLEALISV